MNDEFELIRDLIQAAHAANPDSERPLTVPPGDDACLLRQLRRPVITTDTQREDVHFKRSWLSPEEIGRKAVAVTLSDLAASYATPISLFVNLGLPVSFSRQDALRLYQGIGAGLARYGCTLGGGNLSGSEKLSLDLFAVGEGNQDLFPLRSMAMPGDGLYATGCLGLARAGLESLKNSDGSWPVLIDAFKDPRARFDAAKVLADHNVCCVMDISDGLKGDAKHIATASNLTIELAIEQNAFPRDLLDFCAEKNFSPEEFAMAGGEDYELLFACPPETFEKIRNALPEAHPVGRCIPFTGEYIVAPSSEMDSFRHGKDAD